MSARRRRMVYFMTHEEGWFRGVIVSTKNTGNLVPETRLEVEDVEALEPDETGDFIPIPGSKDGRLQTFFGDEIKEFEIFEDDNFEKNKRGLTEKKKELRARNNNSHLKPYVELDYSNLCLAGRSARQSVENNTEASSGTRDISHLSRDADDRSNPLNSESPITNGQVDMKIKTKSTPSSVNPADASNSPAVEHALSSNDDHIQDRLLNLSNRPSTEQLQLSKTNEGIRYPTDYIIVDDLAEDFFRVIEEIRGETEIGLALSGQRLGRRGTLSWIQIGTKDTIYLFDFASLGSICFSRGLKSILESPAILKVMYDSRRPADILFHQFKVSLHNVFDVMAADAKIQGDANYGHWPLYVRRLGAVLKEYMRHLQLTEEAINLTFVRSRDPSLDEKIFAERPISERTAEVLVRDVMYLLALHRLLKNLILSSVFRASDICLSELRETRDETRWMDKSEKQECVPEAFQQFTRHTDGCVDRFPDASKRRFIDRDVNERGFYASVHTDYDSLTFIPSHNSVACSIRPAEEKPIPPHLRLNRRFFHAQFQNSEADPAEDDDYNFNQHFQHHSSQDYEVIKSQDLGQTATVDLSTIKRQSGPTPTRQRLSSSSSYSSLDAGSNQTSLSGPDSQHSSTSSVGRGRASILDIVREARPSRPPGRFPPHEDDDSSVKNGTWRPIDFSPERLYHGPETSHDFSMIPRN